MRGCRSRQVLSAGHRVLFRKFSAPAASVDLDRRQVFEGIFQGSSPLKLDQNQLVGSEAFLINKFGKAVHSKVSRKKSSEQRLSEEDLDLFDEVGLLQVFKHLIEDLSVDHAVLLCTNLPANHLKAGINTLITLLVERLQHSGIDITEQIFLADKILELVKQSECRNCSVLEETRQKLLKWLPLNSGDVLRCSETLQLLCEENIHLPQAEGAEKTTIDNLVGFSFVGPSSILDTNSGTAKAWSNILDKVDVIDFREKTRLLGAFFRLGKSASTGKDKEICTLLKKLLLKGMPEEDLRELIDSFTNGLTKDSRNIRRGVEAFKKTTQLLKLNTVASFNALIAHCANHGEIDICIDLIQTMKLRGLEPCASSYEPLIRVFAKSLEISKAEDILQIMRLSGMRASVQAYASLVGAHAKAENFARAYNLIEDIPCEELAAYIYTPIIHAYGMKGQITQALSVLNQMKKKHVKPIGESFASLINACAIRKNCKGAEKVFQLYMKEENFSEVDHENVMAAMLRVYAGHGDLEWLKKMTSCSDMNFLETRKGQSALLRGFSETGRNEEALKIYNEIRSRGGYPESNAFCTFLWSLGNTGELDQLLALFEPFRKSVQGRSRVLQEELISIACSHIVYALISHNHLEEALVFLQHVQLEDAGDVETMCLQVFMADKQKFPVRTRVHLALKDKVQFLQAMEEKLKIRPTRLAYESLLQSCANEKDLHHAEAVLLMMKSANLRLNLFTYMIMLRIVTSRGDSERASLLLSEMRQTMQSNGLMDKHVKMVIETILKNEKLGLLMNTIYPQ